MNSRRLLHLGLFWVTFVFTSTLSAQMADDWYNSALAKYQQGDFDGAIADYTEAIKLNPKDADTYSNRGLAKEAKGDLDGAIADCTEAIKLNPEDADAYSNRGVAKGSKGDLDRAIADFDRAIESNPYYADAYSNRALAREAKNNLAGAIADYERVIVLKPEDVHAYNALAWLWATSSEDKIRNGPNAVKYATKACELTQWQDANDINTLAAADAEAGNFDDAVKWENKYLKSDLSKDAADKARQRLSLYQQKKPYHEAKKSN